MLLTWMAYATLIGALVAAGATALDSLVLRRGVPTRFVWLTALVIAVVVPVLVGLRSPPNRPAPLRVPPATAPTGISSASPVSAPLAQGRAGRFARVRVQIIVFLLRADPYLGRAWLALSLVYAAFVLRAIRAVRRRRRQWPRIEVDTATVLVSPDTGPAVVGVVQPYVVLPQWALSMDAPARSLMLRHELAHIAARDPLLLGVSVLMSVLLPWNAAVWAITRRLRLAIEIDCDQRVIGAAADAREYGELLLRVGSRRRLPELFVVSLVERHGFLEQRIKAMTSARPRHPRIAAALLVLVAIAVTTAAVRAPRPSPRTDHIAGRADSLTIAELRALLAAHQPDALIAATGINTVTVLLDANGNYVTSLAETRVVTSGGGRGGRGGILVVAGDLQTGTGGGVALSDGRAGPGGRARGNVRNGFTPDSFPPPGSRITKSNEMRQVDPATGDTSRTIHVSSLSMVNGDTVILSLRESTGEVGFIKHVYITLDGPIGAGEIFGFNENVLGNLVAIQQVKSVHAHAYVAGELAEQRLNVFVVRLKS
jgi:beta-lactamase regulating signal transducer with metallopeptidase domain